MVAATGGTPLTRCFLDTAQGRGIDALLDLYAQDVRDVAREGEVTLVEVFNAFGDHDRTPGQSIDDLLLAGDGIHPDNDGQRLVCEVLTEPVVAEITTPDRPVSEE